MAFSCCFSLLSGMTARVPTGNYETGLTDTRHITRDIIQNVSKVVISNVILIAHIINFILVRGRTI